MLLFQNKLPSFHFLFYITEGGSKDIFHFRKEGVRKCDAPMAANYFKIRHGYMKYRGRRFVLVLLLYTFVNVYISQDRRIFISFGLAT